MPYVNLYFVQNTHWPVNADAKCKAEFFFKQFNAFGEGRL